MASLSTKKKRAPIQHSDPGKILDLIQNLYDDSCSLLQEKINRYIMEECEAELAMHIIIYSERLEAYTDTIGQTSLPRKTKVIMTPKLLEILKTNLNQTELLSQMGIDFQTLVNPYVQKDPNPLAKKRIVFLPIADKNFSIIMCVFASKLLPDNVGDIVEECYTFVWPLLKKSIAVEYERTLKQNCQQLLKVAKRLFTQVASLDQLLQLAMEQATSLIKAQYCSVKMIDVDRMQLVEAPVGRRKADEQTEGGRRFPLDQGIAGQVLKSGNLVNCKVAKDNPHFDKEIDSLPDVDCKTLLCFPIRDQTGIIGVGMLINKVQDPYFDGMDEEMALAFSIYSGVCIMHSVVYKRIQEAHIRNALANELVMYHMKVSDQEVCKMLECTGFHGHPHIATLHFNPRSLPLRELPCYGLKFFKDLGFIDKFHLKPEKLASFMLHVKKGYRDVPYHSWLHAFNVAQWAYAAMMTFKLISGGYLNDLQGLIYLVAGLVHDLDHRGTTNSFQLAGQTSLAALYSSEGSVMERHHLAQAMCILNTEGCDILESLPRRDYDRALILLRDYILASDLTNYFKNKEEYMTITKNFQKSNKVHNTAFMALLMNAADLSDQLKDWSCVKKTAAAVLTEFFNQGDVEKSRGALPAAIMDRDKCVIPHLEIQFLNSTCMPLFEMLTLVLPRASACIKVMENHIERWDAAKPIFAEVPTTAGLSVLLSPELDHLIELEIAEKERLAREAEEAAIAAAQAAEEAARLAAEKAAAEEEEEGE